ncbi:MAG TPA: hypothetical protein VIO80_08590 [Candidatus Dormibacteraeota bacterium]|jgi:hypothetical protein
MVRIPRQRSGPSGDAADRVEVAITQAQYMIGIYAEILAMDKAIMERIRRLIVRQSDNGDRESDLTNLRLILAQLEKVGQRIAYWNVRLRRLVRGELSPRAGSQGSSYGGIDQ